VDTGLRAAERLMASPMVLRRARVIVRSVSNIYCLLRGLVWKNPNPRAPQPPPQCKRLRPDVLSIPYGDSSLEPLHVRGRIA